MEHLDVAMSGLAVVAAAMTALWLLSLKLEDASIVDPFWAPGFFLACLTYVAWSPERTPRSWLVLALVGLWAVRLGTHLLRRNLASGEDPRYRAMRASHGERFGVVSLFTVFWLQAVLLWIVSAPLFAAATSPAALGVLDLLGAMVMLTGILLEAVADRQLRAFRADPSNRGRVLDSGLWRYSRHPNYFGNAVLWWGAWLVAVGAGGAWTVFGPVLMTFLLLKVSGVALLERGIEERRARPRRRQDPAPRARARHAPAGTHPMVGRPDRGRPQGGADRRQSRLQRRRRSSQGTRGRRR